jgi:hypothetical protein
MKKLCRAPSVASFPPGLLGFNLNEGVCIINFWGLGVRVNYFFAQCRVIARRLL